MNDRLQHLTASRFLTVVALLLILLGLTGIQLLVRDQFADARVLREQAGRIIASRTHLADLLELHLDAETAVRGYVLTGQDQFLVPYRNAINRREKIFAALQQDGATGTIDSLPTLRQLSEEKLANAEINFRDADANNAAAARERIAGGRGRIVMDEIRQVIARLDHAEAQTLARLESQSETKRQNVERLIAVVLIGIAVLLIAATLLIGRTTAQRRAALASARQVAEQEKAMFDGAVDGMLLLDARGGIIRANPSVERMFGYSAQDLSGRSNMFLMAEPFSDEQSLAWLARVGRAGADGAGKRQEFLGKRANGTTFETEIAISRFGDHNESQFVTAIRDVTHRKHAERMKSEFVSTVSHELRTPLTSIGGSLALLAGGAVGKLEDRAARLVTIAHSNCERLIRLINDLLDIEKIESGKMSFDMRRLMIGPLVLRTVTANRQFANDHEVSLEIGLPPWPQYVIGDPDRLEQVLTNLVSNAIKYSPPGESVYVTTNQSGGTVRIEVCDRGSGVPEDFRERIFSKFAMADSSDARTRGGTGLGLTIVREIAARHGGSAGFADRGGGGSIFYLELPLLAGNVPANPNEQTDLPLLLHIDDDIDCLTVVASAFAGRATLVSAATMDEARALLIRRTDFSGCIIDVGMGADSGLDILPAVRAIAPELPIVLFTARDEPHAEAQANAVLVKSRTSVNKLVETTMALVSPGNRNS
ncbi:ATP-binding protein [uncultured Erythrobacter sp.]|uniref:ATP-binding protein n=1 Tax=uncultured Erythrobacter sp. TaxID=263913 RepID=UPI0026587267|nr:ATP-binding protein [uncultured Erythrobacter sp.]